MSIFKEVFTSIWMMRRVTFVNNDNDNEGDIQFPMMYMIFFKSIFRNKHSIYSCTLVNSVSSEYEISFDINSETLPPFWLLLAIPIWLYASMPYASMLDGFSHVSVSPITENLWSRFSMSDSNDERLAGTLLMLRWSREKWLLEIPFRLT